MSVTKHTNISNVKILTTNYVYLDSVEVDLVINFKYYTIRKRDYGKTVRNYNPPKSLRNYIFCK